MISIPRGAAFTPTPPLRRYSAESNLGPSFDTMLRFVVTSKHAGVGKLPNWPDHLEWAVSPMFQGWRLVHDIDSQRCDG